MIFDFDVGELIGLKDFGDSCGDFVIVVDVNIDVVVGNEINVVELSLLVLSVFGDVNVFVLII